MSIGMDGVTVWFRKLASYKKCGLGWAKKDGFEAAAVAKEECVKNGVAVEPRAVRTGKSNGKFYFAGNKPVFLNLKSAN